MCCSARPSSRTCAVISMYRSPLGSTPTSPLVKSDCGVTGGGAMAVEPLDVQYFAQVAQGAANTDCLLIFYEEQASFNDAVIVRYQEGGTSEADFSGELDVVAVLNQAVNFSDGDII